MIYLCIKRKARYILLTIIIIGGFFLWLLWPINNRVDLNDNKYYIAHAGGSIDDHIYTNSKEALLFSIYHGYKYIEIDLQLGADSSLLAIHNIKEYHHMTGDTITKDPPSLIEFKSKKILNKYTPMTINDVIEIRELHPFCLITDKTDDPDIINKYFSQDKKNLIIEVFSWQRYNKLTNDGYTTFMAFYKKNLIHYLYYCIRCRQIIPSITTSSESSLDILKFRILKKLFGVKIIFVPTNQQMKDIIPYIGNEYDMIYINNKEDIQYSL